MGVAHTSTLSTSCAPKEPSRSRAEGGLEPLGDRAVEKRLAVAVRLRVAEARRVGDALFVESQRPRGGHGGRDGAEDRGGQPARMNALMHDGVQPQSHVRCPRQGGDDFAARHRPSSALARGEEGGKNRHEDVVLGDVFGIVEIVRVNHGGVQPGRRRRGYFSSEDEHRGFGRAAPADVALDDLGIQGRGRAGQGAGERIHDEVSGGAYGLCGQILEAEVRVMRNNFLHGIHLRLRLPCAPGRETHPYSRPGWKMATSRTSSSPTQLLQWRVPFGMKMNCPGP